MAAVQHWAIGCYNTICIGLHVRLELSHTQELHYFAFFIEIDAYGYVTVPIGFCCPQRQFRHLNLNAKCDQLKTTNRFLKNKLNSFIQKAKEFFDFGQNVANTALCIIIYIYDSSQLQSLFSKIYKSTARIIIRIWTVTAHSGLPHLHIPMYRILGIMT